ncbi:hypothetical protein ANN_27264 [Periplaneta americana]|uniref:Transposase n=1 Tax=Periplaneta americana TaxID=6978 RepID=A0ABQ8RY40_PERAM|nr:hypothetical protein ANN_27264 [Periplaneta americana]
MLLKILPRTYSLRLTLRERVLRDDLELWIGNYTARSRYELLEPKNNMKNDYITELFKIHERFDILKKCGSSCTLYDDGRSVRYIANVMNMARSTTHEAIKRYRETLEYTRRPSSCRPRATNPNEDRYMVLRVLRERNLPATSVAQQFVNMHGRPISAKTVRRRLKASGLISSRPATGPRLLRMHRVERLCFANDHRDWRNGQWSCVLFTDESRFNLCSPDGRERVWRRRRERFSQCCISENVPYGGGGVMVWAGVCTDARTEFVFVENGRLTADRYINECLADHVVPFGQFVGDNFVLMHDNAQPHIAHAVGDYLQEVGIHVLPWPARSPDMNPNEHVWDMLGRRVKNRRPRPESLQELRRALGEEWELIPQEEIGNQIESMPRRMDAVIQARRGCKLLNHLLIKIRYVEYADIVYVYGLYDGSSLRAVAEYERRFPNRRVPYRRVFTV